MTPLDWQETPQKGSANPEQASASSSGNNPPVASSPALSRVEGSNPWFGIAIGLMGVIAGFAIGTWRNGVLSQVERQPRAAQRVAAPTAPVVVPRAWVPSGTGELIIKMTAELWKFTPNVVTLKQGEKVAFEITAVSGTHGFAVPGLSINETIIQGRTVRVNIPTDKTGTFDFRCSVQCGSGHNEMKGQVIIES